MPSHREERLQEMPALEAAFVFVEQLLYPAFCLQFLRIELLERRRGWVSL